MRVAWTRSRRSVRAALAAAVAIVLMGMALPTYHRWELSYVAKARKEATLNHNYAELLTEQLARWRLASKADLAAEVQSKP